jgi:hypothetical protein
MVWGFDPGLLVGHMGVLLMCLFDALQNALMMFSRSLGWGDEP